LAPIASFSGDRSCRVKGAGELGIGVVSELVGDDRAKAGEEQQLTALRQVADLIGGEQRPAGVLLGEGEKDSPDFSLSRARLMVWNTTVYWPSRSDTCC
jgi:hypothetical protein